MEKVGEVGETSFESWAQEIYLQCPEIITIWSQSSNAYTRAAAILIMRYAGGKKHGQ